MLKSRLREVLRLLCGGRNSTAEKGCKWRDFVRRAFDADDRRAIDLERGPNCGLQFGDVVDIHRVQPGKHRGQSGTQSARAETVVAVKVVIEQLLARHAHGVRMVVEQQEGNGQSILQRGVNLHAVHEE